MKREFLKPTNDIIFKLLFGEVGRENILKDLLEAILNIEIERVIVDKQKEKILDEQELHFIELPKFMRSKIDMDDNNLWRTRVEEGREEGIQKGLKEGTQKIIKAMKKSGMSNEEIARVTELPLEEVKKI